MSPIKRGHSVHAHREDIEDHVLRQRVRADERLELLRVNRSAAVDVNRVEKLAEVRVRHHGGGYLAVAAHNRRKLSVVQRAFPVLVIPLEQHAPADLRDNLQAGCLHQLLGLIVAGLHHPRRELGRVQLPTAVLQTTELSRYFGKGS